MSKGLRSRTENRMSFIREFGLQSAKLRHLPARWTAIITGVMIFRLYRERYSIFHLGHTSSTHVSFVRL